MKQKFISILAIGALAAAGALAGCHDDYGKKKPGGYGKTPPPKCEKVVPTPIELSQPPTQAETDACTAAGGSVAQVGLLQSFQCILPFCDAGESCTDSSQCIGSCFAVGAPPIGTPTTGQCQPDSSPFGCRAEVTGGIVGPTICVD